MNKFFTVFVITVQNPYPRSIRTATVKKNSLCREILLHGLVIVEVVARKVRKSGDIKRYAIHALLLECMRRDFHHCLGSTLFQGIREMAIEFQRFGSCMGCRKNATSHMIFNGTDQKAPALCRPQNRLDQKRGCAFSIRSSNARHRNFSGWLTVVICAKSSQSFTSMGYLRPRYALPRLFRRRVCNDRDCPSGDRLIDKAISVAGFAFHRDKEIAMLDPSRVVLKSGDIRIAALRQHLDAIENILKIH